MISKAICLAALGRRAEAQDAVRACRKLGLELVKPDLWEEGGRRLYPPEGFALMAPGFALYREIWNATPEGSAP